MDIERIFVIETATSMAVQQSVSEKEGNPLTERARENLAGLGSLVEGPHGIGTGGNSGVYSDDYWCDPERDFGVFLKPERVEAVRQRIIETKKEIYGDLVNYRNFIGRPDAEWDTHFMENLRI